VSDKTKSQKIHRSRLLHFGDVWVLLHQSPFLIDSNSDFLTYIKGRLENRGGAPMGVQVFWGVKKR